MVLPGLRRSLLDKIIVRKKILLFASSFLILMSCNTNMVFNDGKDFENNRWYLSNQLVFIAEIEDINQTYKLLFKLSHVYEGLPFESLPIKMEIETPSGKISENSFDIKIMSRKEHAGSCSGDYCDIEQLIEDKYKFEETGKFIFRITQLTSYDPLPNVMRAGLIIEMN